MFDDYLKEKLKDHEFKAEYDKFEPEFKIVESMMNARKNSGYTQKQLSKRTGINQSDISKLETGNANPSLRTLKRLAEGMGMTLEIVFKPKDEAGVQNTETN
jgi:DNA-binding XRE family transcriptional regulator